MIFYTEGFGRFVTSTTAPIATGWSDRCRVGIPPTERTRLFTAHCNMQVNRLKFYCYLFRANHDL